MIIVEKSESGAKVEYGVTKAGKLTLNDELTLNLPQYERDYDVHLVISKNEYGMLILGNGKAIVAELDIPAREYTYVEEGTDGEGNIQHKKVAVDFSHEKVTFTRWPLAGGVSA